MRSRTPHSVVLMVTSEMTAQAFLRGYLSFLREHGRAVTIRYSSLSRDQQSQDGRHEHLLTAWENEQRSSNRACLEVGLSP